MMRTTLRRNTQSHASLKYFVDVDLSQSVVRPQQVTIPVHRHRLTVPQGILRELYTADLAGFRLQAGNIHNIERMVRKLLPALVNYARLPDYVFIACRSQRIYPVYTFGDEVIATTPGGPVFRHVELAKVRAYLTEYMHTIGELGTPGKSDKLHVRGVSRRTLALLRPVFYLKKRIPGQTEFWAPVFEAEDGCSIYAYVASAKREVAIDNDRQVLALRHICAEALIADKRLLHNYDLRVDRLMPHYWADMQVILRLELRSLMVGQNAIANGVEISLYRNGAVVIAVEARGAEDRQGLFVGDSAEDLRQRLAQDYVRRGLIDRLDVVRIVPAQRQEPPAGQVPASLLDRPSRVA